MIHLVVLNELSLFALLALAAGRRSVHVLAVAPWLPFLRPPLAAVAAFLRRRRLLPADAAVETFLAYQDRLAPGWKTTDVYRRAEPWLERRFGFAALDAEGYAYGFPFKNVTVNHFQWHLGLFYVIAETARRFPDRTIQVVGFDAETVAFHAACHGPVPGFGAASWPVPRALLNAVLTLAVLGLALRRVAGWVRPAKPHPVPVLLGVDLIGDYRILTMLGEVADHPSQVLGVFRNAGQAVERRDWIRPYPSCLPHDGALGPGDALATLAMVAGRGFALWRRFRRLAPRHFLGVAKFPLIEATYRAMMEKYRFAHFLGRDDYNVDHIFRSMELRRRGGVSMGISHGTGYDVEPSWRYLDFDVYYTIGEGYFRDLYLERWPAGTRLQAVGGFGMSGEQRRRAAAPKPDDIIFFIKLFIEGEAVVDAVRDLARAFPERTVYMKLKGSELRGLDDNRRARLTADLPANVVFTTERPGELLLRARYAVSTPSTVVLEAIEAHCITFCYDVLPEETPFHFRQFPGLCHRSVEDIAGRIRAVEAGEWSYPRRAYADLVDLSERDAFAAIRADIGLAPRPAAAELPAA